MAKIDLRAFLHEESKILNQIDIIILGTKTRTLNDLNYSLTNIVVASHGDYSQRLAHFAN